MTWDSGTEILAPRTTWSPTLKSLGHVDPSGWSPVSYACYYMQFGKLVVARFRFTATSATWGSGAWYVQLPVSPASRTMSYVKLGEAYLYEATSTAAYMGTIMQSGTSDFYIADVDGWFVLWGYGTGLTWTSGSPSNGSSFSGTLFYEAA